MFWGTDVLLQKIYIIIFLKIDTSNLQDIKKTLNSGQQREKYIDDVTFLNNIKPVWTRKTI